MDKKSTFRTVILHGLTHQLNTVVLDAKKALIPAAPSRKGAMASFDPEAFEKVQLRQEFPLRPKQCRTITPEDRVQAFHALCGFRESLEDERAAAQLLVVTLLAQVSDLCLENLPGIPIVNFGAVASFPEIVCGLLEAVQGPPMWGGKGWSLKRPWVLRPVVALGSGAPSRLVGEYIGGRCKTKDGKRRFYLPYACVSLAFAPGLPASVVESVARMSPLAVPIFCGGKPKAADRPTISIDGNAFDTIAPEKMEALLQNRKLIWMLLNDFFRWLRKKPRRVQMWLDDVPTFRPAVRQGRFVHIVRTPESEILAVSMALFKALLHFASARRAWISTEEAQKVLMAHWNLLLPESCPLGSKGDGVSAVCQDSRDALFQFMAEAIAARGDAIVPEGGSRTAETWGAVHSITSIRYLIFPRERFLSDYLVWLKHNGAAVPDRKDRWETQMQGKLLEWGIPVKTETKDTTWRFQFYERGHAPKGQKEKLPCLAFSVLQLPPKVLTALEKRFVRPFGTTVEPESVREEFELKTVEKLEEN